jgi:cephalosporin-C deacetylase-like acetyl esterase
VLGVAGHSTNGKASATYQKAFIGFVKKGIAVLAYDPPGQGERLEYLDTATGKSRAGIGVGEHLMAGVPSLLTGQSIARHFVWDGIRAFDYLLTRPEIDPRRIGVAGNSGGGTQAAYLALFEPRLAAVVSSCYMTGWRQLWTGPGPQDAEQIWPGFLANHLDFSDFALALAPRPFLITSAIRDYFPIDGARATFRQLQRLFDLQGKASQIGMFEYDDTHGWSQPRREAATRWFEKYFFDRESPGREDAIETEEESQLYATPTGQLATSLGSQTTQGLASAHARQLALSRPPATASSIRAAIRFEEPASVPVFKVLSRQAGPTLSEELIELTVTGGVPIPARLLTPPQARAQVLLVGAAEKGIDADTQELLSSGHAVLILHPRGSGPSYPDSGSSGYDLPYQVAARTWLIGKNLLAMQTEDLVAGLRLLRDRDRQKPVSIFARGRFGLVGLLAAALDSQVQNVILEGSLLSWQALLDAPTQKGFDHLIAPGLLQVFDTPDLLKLLGQRRVFWINPLRPEGALVRQRLPEREIILRGEMWPLSRTLPQFFNFQ